MHQTIFRKVIPNNFSFILVLISLFYCRYLILTIQFLQRQNFWWNQWGFYLAIQSKVCPLQSHKYFRSRQTQLPMNCSPSPVFGMDSILLCTLHQDSLIKRTALKFITVSSLPKPGLSTPYHKTAAEPQNLLLTNCPASFSPVLTPYACLVISKFLPQNSSI